MKIVMKCKCGWKSRPMTPPPPPPEELGSLTYHCQACNRVIACQDRIPSQ